MSCGGRCEGRGGGKGDISGSDFCRARGQCSRWSGSLRRPKAGVQKPPCPELWCFCLYRVGWVVAGALVRLIRQWCLGRWGSGWTGQPGSEASLGGPQDRDHRTPPWWASCMPPAWKPLSQPWPCCSQVMGSPLGRVPLSVVRPAPLGRVNTETWATQPAALLSTATRSFGLLWPLSPLGGQVSWAAHFSLLKRGVPGVTLALSLPKLLPKAWGHLVYQSRWPSSSKGLQTPVGFPSHSGDLGAADGRGV